MTEGRSDPERVADQLAEALEALRHVDLNVLLDEDVRTVLDAKGDLLEVCLRQRQDQWALKRAREQQEDES